MIIYKITNSINNKIYIGQTITTLKKRWNKHCSEARLNKSMAIARAIIKYSSKNFTIEQIDSANTKEELNQKEINWIQHYQSCSREKGYNISLGGNNVNLCPEAEARRIKKLIKQVHQYDLNGSFIKTWEKVKDAENFYNDSGQVISKCARQHGYSKTAKGFQWNYEYVKQMNDVSKCARIGKKNHQPKILMKNNLNITIKIFNSINDAAEYIVKNKKTRTKKIESIVDNIYRFIYQKRKVSHAYGYIWEYN